MKTVKGYRVIERETGAGFFAAENGAVVFSLEGWLYDNYMSAKFVRDRLTELGFSCFVKSERVTVH